MAIEVKSRTVSAREAAKIVGLGKDAVYRAIRDGRIPCIQLGRTIRIPTDVIEKMLVEGLPQRNAHSDADAK